MSSPEVVDAGAPPTISDDDEHEFTGKVGAVDSDGEGTPRITVEENGVDADDDLFGDGGDDDEDEEDEEEAA
jgi:RNA polymerase-associated protein LEO1